MPHFDPEYPTTENSLNRVPIVDLPGYPLAEQYKGTVGYQLVSTQALENVLKDAKLVQDGQSADDARRVFYNLLAEQDPRAEAVATEMGKRLGILLLALHRGDAVNRQARGEWSDSHWEYWTSVTHISLAGGIPTGLMGQIMAQEAGDMLSAVVPGYKIEVADHPQHLPLLGAARYVLSGDRAFVLDFGGSYVKRGRATYQGDQLCALDLLPSIPVRWRENDPAEDILNAIVEVIAATCGASQSVSTIPISIASYVDQDGNPLQSQGGIYMKLRQLSDNIPGLISDRLASELGYRVNIRLLHDGTAAASFYSPIFESRLSHSAVIMMGTALGVGFPVERPYLCAVSEMFLLHESL